MSRNAEPSTLSVACIGECMVELSGTPFGQLTQGFGGDTYNTAVYLRRCLPEQAAVHYITAIGEDPLSDALVNAWQQEGIRADYCRRLPNKVPGLYQIFVDDQGERRFIYWRNDSAAKYMFDDTSELELTQQLSAFSWVYLSGITLAILTQTGRQRLLSALASYRDAGGRVAFDNNYRPALWSSTEDSRSAYRSVLALCDLALLTEEDEQQHFGLSSADAIFEHAGCPEIVLKRGADPCLVKQNTGVVEIPAKRLDRVVDSTAAGDSFAAGYLARRMLGAEPEEAAAWGHALASRVIQAHGAIISRQQTRDLEPGQTGQTN